MSNAFVVTECKPEPQISTKLLKSRLRHPETPDAGASKDQTLRNLQVKLGLRFQWVYPTSFLRAAHQRPGIPTTQPGEQNSIFAFPFKIKYSSCDPSRNSISFVGFLSTSFPSMARPNCWSPIGYFFWNSTDDRSSL